MADRDAVDSHFTPATAEEGRVLLKTAVIVSMRDSFFCAC